MAFFSALGDLVGGFLGRDSAKIQEEQAKLEMKMAKLRGKQIVGESRRGLLSTQGTVKAIRSARGVSGDSQTGQLIESATRDDAFRAEAVARLAELNRASAARMAADGYALQAKWAIPLGVMRMVGTMESEIAKGMGGGGGG